LVENANEAIFVIQDGMLRFFNIKNIELIGYSKEELTSTPFINFVHPDDREVTIGRYLKRIRGEELPGVNVFRVIDKAGNIKWAEVNSVLISWEGRPATLNFLNDITERKRAEDSLRESVEALRAFLNANPEVSFLMDAKGTVLVANESLSKRFSKSSEEIIGSCLYDLFPEDVAKERKSRFDEVFRTGKPVYFEDVRMDRNYETFAHPVFDKEGNVAEVAILGFDITERKRTEEALRASEKRFRELFDGAPVGYHEIDKEGKITRVNRTELDMLGYTAEEMVGRDGMCMNLSLKRYRLKVLKENWQVNFPLVQLLSAPISEKMAPPSRFYLMRYSLRTVKGESSASARRFRTSPSARKRKIKWQPFKTNFANPKRWRPLAA